MNGQDDSGQPSPEPRGGIPPEPVGPDAGGPDEALRSLERLESLAGGAKTAAPLPGPRAARARRPRIASASRPAQGWARVAAPAVFLVAVIVVVSVAFQSGVVGGGGDEPGKPVAKASKSATKSPKPGKSATATATTTAKATPTATGGTRTYTIKPGDTLTGIATRFGTTLTEIEELNPDLDLTTLHPGEKIIVPAT